MLGEKLLIFRRRKGMSQFDAASHQGVSLHKYRKWEVGNEVEGAPEILLQKIEPHEACYILRRRSDLSLVDVAKGVGRCRWWVIQMESGKVNCQELTEYWGI